MDIVQIVSDLAKSKGLTLTELERRLSFPKSSIRKWSENLPSISKVAQVAEFFGCSIDLMYYGFDNSLTKTETDLLNEFRKLDPIKQGQAIERIKCLSEMQELQEPNGQSDSAAV